MIWNNAITSYHVGSNKFVITCCYHMLCSLSWYNAVLSWHAIISGVGMLCYHVLLSCHVSMSCYKVVAVLSSCHVMLSRHVIIYCNAIMTCYPVVLSWHVITSGYHVLFSCLAFIFYRHVVLWCPFAMLLCNVILFLSCRVIRVMYGKRAPLRDCLLLITGISPTPPIPHPPPKTPPPKPLPHTPSPSLIMQ
jgi:hypothetical protein